MFIKRYAGRTVQAVALAALMVAGYGVKADEGCGDVPTLLTETAEKSQIQCALTRSQASSTDRAISIVESEPELEAVSFAINFEFGSSELTPESKQLLATVAEVIAEDEALRKAGYFIDGHTDAVGANQDNQVLGQARAAAAAGHLLASVDFAMAVKVRSFGEEKLLEPDDPTSARNRRVEITPVAAE
ncbi:OmpA family protein [Roseovarius pelagicus]|uniref:OmpA family protein n=1 Tax=Roseovarius pelagicus TaxID=2980108 RepID=A0ABY6D8H8_9RHOB|nr:OmpA family protein [Roseovarius pelagicus]UXX82437.1 OmpA family protein [Roseovarius pelagicus]